MHRPTIASLPCCSEPVLLDADALTCLADDAHAAGVLTTLVGDRDADTVLTPHAGELARLLGESRETVEANRRDSVTRAADAWHATVLLKGSTTLVSDPANGEHRSPVRANMTGTAVLATAGSGDVLSGLAGALLARGLSGRDAASVAAHLHGQAGQRAAREAGATRTITASRIAAALGLDVAGTDPEDFAPTMG
jgi:ADP-dependent NAD(P)H-hydrate dehydratase / NAD(P)H-hydrate epimerase